MAEKIVVGEEDGKPTTREVVQSRKLIPTLAPVLQLLGGDNPDFYFPKSALITPVYSLGGDPNTPVTTTPVYSNGLTTYQIITQTVTATAATAQVSGATIQPTIRGVAVTDMWLGCRLYSDAIITAFTDGIPGGNQVYAAVEGSFDGTTWYEVYINNQIWTSNTTLPSTYSAYAYIGATLAPANEGLMYPYLRGAIKLAVPNQGGAFAFSATMRLWITAPPATAQ